MNRMPTCYSQNAGILLVLCGLALLHATGAGARISEAQLRREEAMKRLVAMVDVSKPGGASEMAAAIVVGRSGDDLLLATALHVVADESGVASDVVVRFYDRPDSRMSATVLPVRPPAKQLDLAVLRVPDAALHIDASTLPFESLPPANDIRRGDDVFHVGRPAGKDWRINLAPERAAHVDETSVGLESQLITEGHSGGALLDARLRLIGMLTEVAQNRAEALAMPRLLEALEQWGVPVSLRLPLPQVSAGGHRTCRLQPEGRLRCWGNGFPFQYYDDETLDTAAIRFRRISVGGRHTCGLDVDGLAHCWGTNLNAQVGKGEVSEWVTPPTPVVGGQTFEDVVAGAYHSCGLTPEGKAYCWGSRAEGQLGVEVAEDSPTPLRVGGSHRFSSLRAGQGHTCGLAGDGELWCWGSAVGRMRTADGSPFDVSDVRPQHILPELRIREVAAGSVMTCALTVEGESWCWGLGQSTMSSDEGMVRPVRVPGRLRFESISAGAEGGHVCGLTGSGLAFCWGDGSMGALSNGDFTTYFPVAVRGGRRFASLSAGTFHTCGVTRSGNSCCWGSNRAGEIRAPASSEPVLEPFCTGEMHAPDAPIELAPEDRRDRLEPVVGEITGEKLAELHLLAMGGREALSKIRTRVSVGRLEHPLFGLAGPVTLYQKAPDLWKLTGTVSSWYSRYELSYEMGSDGRTGWEWHSGEGAQPLADPIREQYRSLFALHPQLRWASAAPELLGRTRLDGRQVFVLQSVRRGVGGARYYIDAQSNLIAYVWRAPPDLGRGIASEVYPTDFRRVDGVMAPFALQVSFADGVDELRFDTVRHNVELEDSFFGPPRDDRAAADEP
jgi:alpha-tubulin suppressor-like RCC1 family protein